MILFGPINSARSRGTVSLVALCFVAVLGISLASYIAICTRAMQLSNRSFQASVSKQLAEAGLEEALRAFNENNWDDWTGGGISVDWTLDTTNKRATATMTFSADVLGQGATASTATVKLRVDNYDANVVGVSWSSSKSYRIGDLVGYNGVWYRSLQNSNANQTPGDLSWWAQLPIPWTWASGLAYARYDLVNYQGLWYRCHTAHTSGSTILPTSTGYWSPVATLSLNWTSGTTYARGTILCYSGAWYYCITTHTSNASRTPTNTDYWASMLDSSGSTNSPTSSTYSTGISYQVGDYIYREPNNTWYRCVAAQPYTYGGGDFSNTSKWVSSIPYIATAYRNAETYTFNDVVYYNNAWYRYINATSSSGITPGSNNTYWENALNGNNSTSSPGAHGWSSSDINYNLGDAVYYGATGQWYRCIRAHTSSSSVTPASTTYWTNTPLYTPDWVSGKEHGLSDTVRYNGVSYLCIQGHTSSSSILPTNSSYWIGADTTNTSYTWSATTSYSAGAYRCYGGVWYKCITPTTANAGLTPNNSGYWTATWSNSWGVSTGTPVAYAEATVTLTGSPTQRTQLRALLAPAPLFPNAAAATTALSANSGGTVDSYDSSKGSYSSQIGTSTNYSAVLAAGSTITLGSTTVKGYLAWPSPPSGIGTSASVKGPASPASPNMDSTRVSRSPSIPQFTTLPGGANGLTTNWSTTPKGTPLALSTTINIGTPGATTPSRYYYNGTLTIGNSTVTYLRINGPVILYLNGDLFITQSGTTGRIDISSAGSAELHLSGAFKADVGGEGIQNSTTNPKSLIIISDTTSTASHYYSEGVYPLYGVVYIPYSTSNIGFYNNNNSTHVYGAISANNITYSGANLNLHYDTSLRYATFGGVDQPWTVSEWRELPATQRATMP